MGYSKRIVGLGVLISVIFVSYQNCGRIGFEAQRGSLAGMYGLGSAACEGVLKDVYSRTYFPLLSNKCNRCHSNAHGSTDLEISYAAFSAKGVATIDYKATHPHGDNGLNLTSEIGALKPSWDSGQADYLSCMANAANGSSTKLKLTAKVISGIDQTKLDTSWKTAQWDMEFDVPSNQEGKFAATFQVEARYEMRNGAVAGIDFRNPAVKLKTAGKNLEVTGLQIYLDDQLQSGSTTFAGISSIVSTTTYTLLAPQNSVAFVDYTNFQATTLVAFEFVSIKFSDPPADPGTPPPGGTTPTVTFTQLIGADPMYNVFASRCIICHQGAAAPKGLDLTNYATASGASSLIIQRVNSTTAPMPPSGLIPQTERDVITKWINGGTPQ